MRKSLLAVLAAGALLLLVAAPATAGTLDLHDAAGDVTVADVLNDRAPSTTSDPNGDIVFARFQHTATQAVLYVHYRELYVPRQYAGLYYALEGTNGVKREISLDTRHGAPQGKVSVLNARGGKVRCHVSHKVDYVNNSVSMRIPRACLKKPKYLRVSHVSFSLHLSESDVSVAYDDPSREGGTVDEVASKPSAWILTGLGTATTRRRATTAVSDER